MVIQRVIVRCLFVSGLLLAALAGLGGLPERAEARRAFAPPPRFVFKIEATTPLKDLMPTPPHLPAPPPPFLVQELTLVPEVFFQKPLEPTQDAVQKPQTGFSRFSAQQLKDMERMAHVLAKINHLNKRGTDHFLKVLLKSRPDLEGLPFVMGDACRLNATQAAELRTAVQCVRNSMIERSTHKSVETSTAAEFFWTSFQKYNGRDTDRLGTKPAEVAALAQLLGPEPAEWHKGLVRHLAGIDRADASRALARLALFSFEQDIRSAALAALKNAKSRDITDILVHGLRYPWPAVARQAAQAVVHLERKDLVPKLVEILDEPDPRIPVVRDVDGKKVVTVREVVRLNHHHNCLTCHAPAQVTDENANSRELMESLTGAVPIPGQEISPPSFGYRMTSPDLFIRADITYLRQDFSMMMKVPDAKPWPEMQRYDFLVRTRVLTPEEERTYRELLDKRASKCVSPNQQAALTALRGLTGQDAGPSAAAWRKLLSP
ncbi:MAG: hypothetical protein L0Y72_15475 [Gemmataceae bacterium]|nr:hypothetical protein [Gemmataceae bacterium]MCI0740446.1 hypothetical protein [Gemmataceae bacterium]